MIGELMVQFCYVFAGYMCPVNTSSCPPGGADKKSHYSKDLSPLFIQRHEIFAGRFDSKKGFIYSLSTNL